MQYVLRNRAVAGVVIGARSADEVLRDVACLHMTAPEALFDELRGRRLIERNSLKTPS
jgi:aryl-alcohol dehydrogenase-like predicted oxidoreductase